MKKYLLVDPSKEESDSSPTTTENFMETLASQENLSPDRIPRGIEVEENRIFFYCPVGSQEALEMNRLLRRLDVEMEYLSRRLDCQSVPIHLHIHSPGGSIFAGLSIADTIRSCKTDVYTYVDGSAASAATLISVCGKKRYISKNSFMLVHQPQLEWAGKYDDFMDEVENQQKMYEKIRGVYLEKTKMNKKKLDELLDHELWLDAEKCVKLGLVDTIL
jgi:ATP-dependent Clp endopeptidase proteolytic subunit ClpP